MAPVIKSYERIFADIFNAYRSKLGLTDNNVGAVALTLMEAAAQTNFQTFAQIMATLDSKDLDRVDSNTLDLIGQEEDVPRLNSSRASGLVTIGDNSFQKVATKIYAGRNAPITGSSIIYVDDASLFPSSGRIIIGRGTANIENSIAYNSVTELGGYWQINLASPTTKFHNLSENVILAQGGDRLIASGTSIRTPLSAGVVQVTFQTAESAVILDGEREVIGVRVTAITDGAVGNVKAGGLTEFAANPFQNAYVYNPLDFTNGQNREQDFQYKERIKKNRFSKAKGTLLALVNSVIGVQAEDEDRRITSSNITEGTGAEPTSLFVDDGSGYEPTFTMVGYESIINSAQGGEKFIQLNNQAIAKAQLVSVNSEPFNLSGSEKLALLVGSTLSEHQFQQTDFQYPGSATAYEIVASINANANLLFSARTVNGSKNVLLFAKADTNESLLIQVPDSGINADDILLFPDLRQETLYLYRNDELLTKDGNIAKLTSIPFPWILPGSSYDLKISVDGTTPATYTFNSAGLAPFTPSNAPLSAWVAIFNKTIPGITAKEENNRLTIQSNKGASDDASIELDLAASTLLANNQVFNEYEVFGKTSDYSINRGTGQIKLAQQADARDRFDAGTPSFRAYVQTPEVVGGTISVSSSVQPQSGTLWVVADASAEEIAVSITNGTQLDIQNISGNIWRYSDLSGGNAFANVQKDDHLIVWDVNVNYSNTQNNRGSWRISNCSATFVDVEKLNGVNQTITVNSADAIKVVRTSGELQQIEIPSSIYALQTLSETIESAAKGLDASVQNTNRVRISTNSSPSLGKLSLVTSDLAGRNLGIENVYNVDNSPMHVAGAISSTDLGSPEFVVPVVSASSTSSLSPWTSSVTVNITPDKMAAFLPPYGADRSSSNEGKWNGIRNDVSGTTVTFAEKINVRDFLTGDRFFVANGFDFSEEDSLDVILDNNPAIKSISVPLYRTIEVTGSPSPTINTFSANDADGGNISFTMTMGAGFDFSNYRLWSRARCVLDCDGNNNGLILKSAHYGPTGNTQRFALAYPPAENLALSFTVNSGNTLGGTDLVVQLSSGANRVPNYAADTTFDVNSSGVYTHNGGTAPDFLAMSVTVGDIVSIGGATGFSSVNRGVFRVTNVSATSFTVANLAAANQTNIPINAIANLNFYPIDPGCIANTVIDFINDNLPEFMSAELAVGESGAGIIDRTIDDFSTGITQPTASGGFVSFVDGQNWVKTANLASSPQFTSERNLSITSPLYTLVGETFRLIPYNTQQLTDFMGSLAVSGLPNLGRVSAANNGNAIQISSRLFGGAGSVQVSGGTANSASGTIVGSSSLLGGTIEKFSTNAGSESGLHSGSWIKLTSNLPLKKNLATNGTTVFSTNASILTVANAGQFSTPRTHSGDNTTQIQVDKQQNFLCFSYFAGTTPVFTNVIQGDFVTIDAPFSVLNRGTFRVIRADSENFWIENPNGTNESITLSANGDLKFVSANSLVPGDTLVIAGGILGSQNDGVYEVSAATTNTVTILGVFATNTASLPTPGFDNVQAYDKENCTLYRKVFSVSRVNGQDEELSDIMISDYVSQLNGKISDVYEFTFGALNKLGFNTDAIFGTPGYKYNNGLIAEATKVVYGSAANDSVYPGEKAAGTYMEILPPLIKRVKMSFGVKLRAGVPFGAIESSAKSAAMSVINSAGIGQQIAISDIIAAMSTISGIASISVISPTYSSSDDVLSVSANEKLLVINDSDITITPLN